MQNGGDMRAVFDRFCRGFKVNMKQVYLKKNKVYVLPTLCMFSQYVYLSVGLLQKPLIALFAVK